MGFHGALLLLAWEHSFLYASYGSYTHRYCICEWGLCQTGRDMLRVSIPSSQLQISQPDSRGTHMPRYSLSCIINHPFHKDHAKCENKHRAVLQHPWPCSITSLHWDPTAGRVGGKGEDSRGCSDRAWPKPRMVSLFPLRLLLALRCC